MFSVKDSLTDEEVDSGLTNVIRDGLTTQVMVTLTSGLFLVAFALKLGASNTVIGLLAAIPPLMTLMQVAGIYLIQRYRVRKAVCVSSTGISRIFLLLITLIPFLFSMETGLKALMILLLLHSGFASVGGSAWHSWMRDLVPQDRLGAFFSKRMAYATTLGIILSISAGFYLDWWAGTRPDSILHGYSIIFFIGFLAGMAGIYFLSITPEPRMTSSGVDVGFLSLLGKPFRDGNFRNLLVFTGSWAFAVNLAAPFFTVYMLNRLGLDMSLIISLMVISQVMNLLFLRLWGRFSDRFSNKSVLSVCGPLFMFCILAWTFTTLPEKHALTLPLLALIHVFMGVSTAGVTLAAGNIGLKLAPKGEATAYLSANSIVNSLSAGVAPILGGRSADYFAKRQLSVTLNWLSPTREVALQTLNLQQWDFFFVLAFFIGLYSIHRLAVVRETGEVEEEIVIQELLSEVRRETRNLSTASGLRDIFLLPYSITQKTIGDVSKLRR